MDVMVCKFFEGMMATAWLRFHGLFRELGGARTVLYVLDRIMRRISKKLGLFYYIFVAQPLFLPVRLPPTRGKDFSFRLLYKPEPILDLLNRPSEVIRQRFRQGAQCLIATRNDALVGCIWFIRNAYAEDEVRVKYQLSDTRDCVWDFDVFVVESERLGVLFAKQWDAFDALLRPQGIRYTVSRINAFNQRSLASHKRLGAKPCGWALFLRLGPCQWMVSSQYPYLALGGCPSLQIGPSKVSKSASES